jgi:hypothetical protein
MGTEFDWAYLHQFSGSRAHKSAELCWGSPGQPSQSMGPNLHPPDLLEPVILLQKFAELHFLASQTTLALSFWPFSLGSIGFYRAVGFSLSVKMCH